MGAEIRLSKAPGGRVKITFPYAPGHVAEIKKHRGHRWHPKDRYWTLPDEDNIVEKIMSAFGDKNVVIDPSLQLRTGTGMEFGDLRKELVSRKYSPRTVKAYVRYNEELLDFAGKGPDEISNSDVRDYLFHLVEKKEVSTSTLNIAINALRFYYGVVKKKEFVYEMRRPKKDRKLPVVLSTEEVSRILSSVKNPKHKALLMLVYSAGLRVGEVVKLKPEDIDPNRKLIHIRAAKGRKDRQVHAAVGRGAGGGAGVPERVRSIEMVVPGSEQVQAHIHQDGADDILTCM